MNEHEAHTRTVAVWEHAGTLFAHTVSEGHHTQPRRHVHRAEDFHMVSREAVRDGDTQTHRGCEGACTPHYLQRARALLGAGPAQRENLHWPLESVGSSLTGQSSGNHL